MNSCPCNIRLLLFKFCNKTDTLHLKLYFLSFVYHRYFIIFWKNILLSLITTAYFVTIFFVGNLGPNSPYPWDYWPHEDGRSECGYVGLTNLGATCYMASCMQHLYMMPQARASILAANTEHSKHEPTLKELQRMFAYLLVSETYTK